MQRGDNVTHAGVWGGRRSVAAHLLWGDFSFLSDFYKQTTKFITGGVCVGGANGWKQQHLTRTKWRVAK